jgi:hypothetical protein
MWYTVSMHARPPRDGAERALFDKALFAFAGADDRYESDYAATCATVLHAVPAFASEWWASNCVRQRWFVFVALADVTGVPLHMRERMFVDLDSHMVGVAVCRRNARNARQAGDQVKREATRSATRRAGAPRSVATDAPATAGRAPRPA